MKHHSVQAICHFIFLAGIALYVVAFHPACETLASLLVLTGALVESCPRIFQKPLVPGVLLGTVTVASWWKWPPSATIVDAYWAVGMIAAYLLLIPSRVTPAYTLNQPASGESNPAPGQLKWLLGLVLVELVFGTRVPGNELAAMIAIAIGLMALAVDSWLADSMPARACDPARPGIGVSVLRWAVLPMVLVVAATALLGSWVVDATADYHAARRLAQAAQTEGDSELLDFQETMSLGDHRSIDRDPRIAVRLTWESGEAPTGMVYLRALALPDLVVTGSKIVWTAPPRGDRQAAPAAAEPTRWAQVHRTASRSDVVLRPDGSSAVELPEITSDDAGNLYSAALPNREYIYRAGFDDQPVKADPALVQRCLEVDARLNDLPWGRFEDPRWRLMSPEQAAALVCARLKAVCSYDLQNLPAPMPGPGGVLRGFLFGSTPEARRGHCQYFATAAALLLRRAGHPVRCVGGFASDETDFSGVTFRNLHFHAWIEVINSRGEWQRFDPSPETRMARHLAGVQLPAPKAQPSQPPAGEKPVVTSPARHRLPAQATPAVWIMLLSGLAILAVLRAREWFSRGFRRRDPRLRKLQRQNDDLIKVARSIGIVVTPATTLSDIAAALEARTQIPLDEHLRDHLAARFGQGPLPEPWPLAALASAGRAKRY